jgi:hypothetical protein
MNITKLVVLILGLGGVGSATIYASPIKEDAMENPVSACSVWTSSDWFHPLHPFTWFMDDAQYYALYRLRTQLLDRIRSGDAAGVEAILKSAVIEIDYPETRKLPDGSQTTPVKTTLKSPVKIEYYDAILPLAIEEAMELGSPEITRILCAHAVLDAETTDCYIATAHEREASATDVTTIKRALEEKLAAVEEAWASAQKSWEEIHTKNIDKNAIRVLEAGSKLRGRFKTALDDALKKMEEKAEEAKDKAEIGTIKAKIALRRGAHKAAVYANKLGENAVAEYNRLLEQARKLLEAAKTEDAKKSDDNNK